MSSLFGRRFESFRELKDSLDKYMKDTSTTFKVRTSSKLPKAKSKRQIEASLMYSNIRFQCSYFGLHSSSVICPAYLLFKASSDGNSLELVKFCEAHNHPTSETVMTDEHGIPKEYFTLSDFQKNPKVTNDDKSTVIKRNPEVKNRMTSLSGSEGDTSRNLPSFVQELGKIHDADVEVLMDEVGFKGLFYQTPAMKSTMEAFPEFVTLQCSFKTKNGLPICLLLVESGNGESEIVSVCCFVKQERRNLEWFVDTFKKRNAAWIRIRSILTDKFTDEREVLRNGFPNAKLQISVFYTAKIFNRDLSGEKLNLTLEQRVSCMQLLQKMLFSNCEDVFNTHYNTLLESAPSQVLDYYHSKWHPCRNDWSMGKEFHRWSFLEKASNLIDSVNSKLKSSLSENSTKKDFIEQLFVAISSQELIQNKEGVSSLQSTPEPVHCGLSDEEKYSRFLTEVASKVVQKQLVLSGKVKLRNPPENGVYTINAIEGHVEASSEKCSCNFHTAMLLPCRHMFAIRKKENLPIFQRDICHKRWMQEYYLQYQQCLQTFKESHDSSVSTPSDAPLKSASSGTEDVNRREIGISLLNLLGDLMSQMSGAVLEHNVETLKLLKRYWESGHVVTVEHIPIEHIPKEPLATPVFVDERILGNNFHDNVTKVSPRCKGKPRYARKKSSENRTSETLTEPQANYRDLDASSYNMKQGTLTPRNKSNQRINGEHHDIETYNGVMYAHTNKLGHNADRSSGDSDVWNHTLDNIDSEVGGHNITPNKPSLSSGGTRGKQKSRKQRNGSHVEGSVERSENEVVEYSGHFLDMHGYMKEQPSDSYTNGHVLNFTLPPNNQNAVKNVGRKRKSVKNGGYNKIFKSNDEIVGKKVPKENPFGQYSIDCEVGCNALVKVFSYLTVQELLRAGRVCRAWHEVSRRPLLWKTLKMKNSIVSDWKAFIKSLIANRTEHLDLRKTIIPGHVDQDQYWESFLEEIRKAEHLKRLSLCRCSADVVKAVACVCPQLESISARSLRSKKISLDAVCQLENLQELRLRSLDSIHLTSTFADLKSLHKLRHLALTSFKELSTCGLIDIGRLDQLESLELGECTEFNEDFSTAVSKLHRLKKLRLEKATAGPQSELIFTLNHLTNLTHLELINFDVKPGFDVAIQACKQLKKFLIIPSYLAHAAFSNQLVLHGVMQLQCLTHFVWEITYEMLRVTQLFMESTSNTSHKNKSNALKTNTDCIPIMKPLPTPLAEGTEDEQDSGSGKDSDVRVEFVSLQTIFKFLTKVLPSTKVQIQIVPFHATWKETISDASL